MQKKLKNYKLQDNFKLITFKFKLTCHKPFSQIFSLQISTTIEAQRIHYPLWIEVSCLRDNLITKQLLKLDRYSGNYGFVDFYRYNLRKPRKIGLATSFTKILC